jgi:mono/diheme cytochrome c family protein
VVGARTCSINGALYGTMVFPGGVPQMQFLKGTLSASDIQAISGSLNSNPATGQQRYVTACAGCHGMDASGGRVHVDVRGESGGAVFEAIHEDSAMRFLGCLPAADVTAIGKFLRSLGGHGGDDGGHGGDDGGHGGDD